MASVYTHSLLFNLYPTYVDYLFIDPTADRFVSIRYQWFYVMFRLYLPSSISLGDHRWINLNPISVLSVYSIKEV